MGNNEEEKGSAECQVSPRGSECCKGYAGANECGSVELPAELMQFSR